MRFTVPDTIEGGLGFLKPKLLSFEAVILTNCRAFCELSNYIFFSGLRRLVSKMSTNNNGFPGPSRRSKRRVSDVNQQDKGVINTPRKVMKVAGDDEMAFLCCIRI